MQTQHVAAADTGGEPDRATAPGAALRASAGRESVRRVATWSWLAGWPSLCRACERWQRPPSQGAVLKLTGLCGACGRGASEQARALPTAHRAFSRAVGAVDYAWPWDRWVQRLKFEEGLDLAEDMALLCAEAWQRHPTDGPEGNWDSADLPLVVPVPLSAARLRQRGYNQAWELARRFAAALDLPTRPDALLRLKDTRAQAELGLLERQTNLAEGFAAEPRAARDLAGRRIVLIDDVLTTGATADAASRALRQAGASHVDLCVFAVTPPPGSGHVPSHVLSSTLGAGG